MSGDADDARTTIAARIVALLEEAFGGKNNEAIARIAQVPHDANLVEALGIDSLDLVDFQMRIEDDFKLDLSEKQDQLVSVDAIVSFILAAANSNSSN